MKFNWKRTLKGFRELATGWDSYDAAPPNEQAIRRADALLDMLANEDVAPTSIVPSAEGGVGICFRVSDRYADLEFLNTGEVLGVRYKGTEEPFVWETGASENALISSIKSIREHLRS